MSRQRRGLHHDDESQRDDPLGGGESSGDSATFIGRWQELVSTTNWQKGRIIHEWRATRSADGAPPAQITDEAWSRLVGGVTPQHVGRLRRVFERFGQTHELYPGLTWSHFYSALDWTDAEMWLEGASQSRWSVAAMRRKRWETLGSIAQDLPRDEDIVVTELDEDFTPDDPRAIERSVGDRSAAFEEGGETFAPDFGDEENADRPSADTARVVEQEPRDEQDAMALSQPFLDLPELPPDLAEALEAFKLAILRHKVDGFSQVSRDDILLTLDGLRALVFAE